MTGFRFSIVLLLSALTVALSACAPSEPKDLYMDARARLHESASFSFQTSFSSLDSAQTPPPFSLAKRPVSLSGWHVPSSQQTEAAFHASLQQNHTRATVHIPFLWDSATRRLYVSGETLLENAGEHVPKEVSLLGKTAVFSKSAPAELAADAEALWLSVQNSIASAPASAFSSPLVEKPDWENGTRLLVSVSTENKGDAFSRFSHLLPGVSPASFDHLTLTAHLGKDLQLLKEVYEFAPAPKSDSPAEPSLRLSVSYKAYDLSPPFTLHPDQDALIPADALLPAAP